MCYCSRFCSELLYLCHSCPPLPPSQKQHPNQFHRKGDQGQHHHHHGGSSHSNWAPRHHDASDHQHRLPPQRYFESEAPAQDQQEDAVDHLTESETHRRKKRQSSREPQPDPGPIPLFPDHSSGPFSLDRTPVPLFPDQDLISHEPLPDPIPLFPDSSCQPSLDPPPISQFPDQDQIQPQRNDLYRQNSYERCERVRAKHSRRNDQRQSRKYSPYDSPAAMPVRSSKKDHSSCFTNDASHLAGGPALSDCTGPHGLDSEDSSQWNLPSSRGKARWDTNDDSRLLKVDQSSGNDWSRCWSPEPAGAGGTGGDGYESAHTTDVPSN